MRKIILAVIALIALTTPSLAATCGVSLLQAKDNAGTTANVAVVDAGDGSGNCVFKIDPQLHTDLTGATPSGTNRTGFVTLQTDTTGGASSFHALSAASNNSTSVKGSAGTVYSITIVQTTTTLGDFRLYDSASAPTCSSGTGVIANYAIQSNATSPGLHLTFPYGKVFANGIGFCLTGAVSDSDNSNFVTGAQINIEWK